MSTGDEEIVRVVCGIHSHELAKKSVGHLLFCWLFKWKWKVSIDDIRKNMVKSIIILLILKHLNEGFCQQYGMNYKETLALVAKMTTTLTLIVVTSVLLWHLSQIDVENSSMNGDFQEDPFMVPPLSVSHNQKEVCKLKKNLFGY